MTEISFLTFITAGFLFVFLLIAIGKKADNLKNVLKYTQFRRFR